jgi:hypothetical protein
MQVEGDSAQARALFEQAWAARTDHFDASVAAHFLARHQATPADTLHWNAVALHHADTLNDARALELLPSLCLNLADALRAVGQLEEARVVADRALAAVAVLPTGGYADFVRMAIERLRQRLDRQGDVGVTPPPA